MPHMSHNETETNLLKSDRIICGSQDVVGFTTFPLRTPQNAPKRKYSQLYDDWNNDYTSDNEENDNQHQHLIQYYEFLKSYRNTKEKYFEKNSENPFSNDVRYTLDYCGNYTQCPHMYAAMPYKICIAYAPDENIKNYIILKYIFRELLCFGDVSFSEEIIYDSIKKTLIISFEKLYDSNNTKFIFNEIEKYGYVNICGCYNEKKEYCDFNSEYYNGFATNMYFTLQKC